MTDGVHSESLSIGDPNFLNHDQIDSSLGNVWRTIRLPALLGPAARTIAAALDYELPVEEVRHFAAPNRHPVASGVMSSICSEMGPVLVDRSTSVATAQPAHEFFRNVRGLDLCLSTWGPEQGTLVLCLHGILDQGAMWEGVAAQLSAQGYHVVAPDLRGHGRSAHVGPGGSYHLLDYVADVDALLDLPPLANRPVILVGHSLGAAMATIVASLRPAKISGLVLIENLVPIEVRDNAIADQLSTYLNHMSCPSQHPVLPDLASAAARLCQAMPSLSEDRALRLAARVTEPCDCGVCWRWDPLLRSRAEISFDCLAFTEARYVELLRRIQAPTALVYGQDDRQYRLKDRALMETALPHATQVTLPGSHHLHVDAPEALAQVVTQVTHLASAQHEALL